MVVGDTAAWQGRRQTISIGPHRKPPAPFTGRMPRPHSEFACELSMFGRLTVEGQGCGARVEVGSARDGFLPRPGRWNLMSPEALQDKDAPSTFARRYTLPQGCSRRVHRRRPFSPTWSSSPAVSQQNLLAAQARSLLAAISGSSASTPVRSRPHQPLSHQLAHPGTQPSTRTAV